MLTRQLRCEAKGLEVDIIAAILQRYLIDARCIGCLFLTQLWRVDEESPAPLCWFAVDGHDIDHRQVDVVVDPARERVRPLYVRAQIDGRRTVGRITAENAIRCVGFGFLPDRVAIAVVGDDVEGHILNARAIIEAGARVEHLDAEVDEITESRVVLDVGLVKAGQQDVAPVVAVGAAAQEVVVVTATVHRADGDANGRRCRRRNDFDLSGGGRIGWDRRVCRLWRGRIRWLRHLLRDRRGRCLFGGCGLRYLLCGCRSTGR